MGVPHSGVAAIPLHAATANGWQPFGGTPPLRAQRVLKGKGLIDKREKTAGCLPLARSAAAQAAPRPVGSGQALRPVGRIHKDGAPRSWPRPASLGPSAQFTFSRPTEDAAAQAAFPPAMRGQFRNAFQGVPRRTSQVQSLTRTSPSAPDGAATSPRRGGRMGGADGVGGSAPLRVQSAMHGQFRNAFQGAPRRTSQVQSLTGTSPSAPDGAATSPQRGGRMGGADGVGGHAPARDPSLRSG